MCLADRPPGSRNCGCHRAGSAPIARPSTSYRRGCGVAVGRNRRKLPIERQRETGLRAEPGIGLCRLAAAELRAQRVELPGHIGHGLDIGGRDRSGTGDAHYCTVWSNVDIICWIVDITRELAP